MGSVNLLPNLRSRMRCSMSTMFLRSIFVASRSPRSLAAPASAAPDGRPAEPCYVVAQATQRESVAGHGARLHAARRPSTSTSTTSCSPSRRRRRSTRRLNGTVLAPVRRRGPARVHAAADRGREPGRTRSSADDEGHAACGRAVAGAGVDRRAGALPRPRLHEPARPSTRTTCSPAKSRKTVRLGMPHGDRAGRSRCARKQFPFKKSPRVGVWTIQFDQDAQLQPEGSQCACR